MTTAHRTSQRARGFGLVEVLVTVVVLLVGLLGLVGTMVKSQQAEVESYQRVQALQLLNDMVARLNTNRHVAGCYAFTTDAASGAPFLGTAATATPACDTAGTPSQRALALQDLQDWSNLLLGAAETTSAGNASGAMEGARGCISFDAATGIYQVSVAWQGLSPTVAPPAAWSCASGSYGNDDRLRRVVSVTLKIADLGSAT